MPSASTRALSTAGAVAIFAALLGGVAPGATGATAGSPSPPVLFQAAAAVGGVSLSWQPGSVTSEHSGATGFRLVRSSGGGASEWVLPSSVRSYIDRLAPSGVPSSYTLTALNTSGESDSVGPAEVTVPTWDGPYTPSRRALTMVWGQAEASAPHSFPTAETVVAVGPADAVTVNQIGDRFGLSSPDGEITIAAPVQDGDFEVGTAPGQMDVQAVAGATCHAIGGAVKVRHYTRAVDGWAAVSVDADLTCHSGRTLKVQGRWNTPEDYQALSSTPRTVIEAAPGDTRDAVVDVTNTGTATIRLGQARFIDAPYSTTAPLAIPTQGCDGLTLPPGDSCQVTIRYTAGDLGSREGLGVLVVGSERGEFELGTVAGQHTTDDARPELDTSAVGTPASVEVSGRPPTTMDCQAIATIRIEELGGPTPTTIGHAGTCQLKASLKGLTPGTHLLRAVATTADGRELFGASVEYEVARRWLLLSGPSGTVSLDPDGGNADGGRVGGPDYVTGLDASPDRSRMAVALGNGDGGLYVASLPTGTLIRGLSHDAALHDDQPAFSPDGKRVAFRRPGYTGDVSRTSALGVVSADGGSVTLIPNSADLSGPEWTPDGRRLVAAGSQGIVHLDPGTGVRTPVPGTSGATQFAVAVDGRIAMVDYYVAAVTIVDPEAGATRIATPFSGATDVAWDPTGRWLAVTRRDWWWDSGQAGQTTIIDTSQSPPTVVRTVELGGYEVSWFDPQGHQPTVNLSMPSWSAKDVTVGVRTFDDDDGPGAMKYLCRLDGGSWEVCGQTWTVRGLTAGRHSLSTRVTDPMGLSSPVYSQSLTTDLSAPAVRLTALPAVTVGASQSLVWSATDSDSGVSSFDVRYRYAAAGSGLGTYAQPSTWQRLTARSLSVQLNKGYRYCYSVRSRDGVGNVSAWTPDTCTAAPLDDRGFAASTGWTRGGSSAYFSGTWTRTSTLGATLRATAQGRRAFIVATLCSTCGSVDVYLGSTKLGRVSLYSATTKYKRVLWLPALSTSRGGTLLLKSTSSRPVIVDGAGLVL